MHILYNENMDFGEQFKQIRKQCGYSQKEVADHLSIYQSNVSDWEKNVSRPEYENLIKLAVLYNVTLEDLLGLPATFPHDSKI